MNQHPQVIWCLAADNASDKHFDAGQPVYSFPPLWSNWGSRLRVLGRARGTSKIVSVVVRTNRLTNWRAEQISDGAIIRRFWDAWDDTEESRVQAQAMVAEFVIAPKIKPILTRQLPYIGDFGIDP